MVEGRHFYDDLSVPLEVVDCPDLEESIPETPDTDKPPTKLRKRDKEKKRKKEKKRSAKKTDTATQNVKTAGTDLQLRG